MIDRQPFPPPIIDATPESLEINLRQIRTNPAHFRALAKEGPRFACTYHDGIYAVEQQAGFFGIRREREGQSMAETVRSTS